MVIISSLMFGIGGWFILTIVLWWGMFHNGIARIDMNDLLYFEFFLVHFILILIIFGLIIELVYNNRSEQKKIRL